MSAVDDAALLMHMGLGTLCWKYAHTSILHHAVSIGRQVVLVAYCYVGRLQLILLVLYLQATP